MERKTKEWKSEAKVKRQKIGNKEKEKKQGCVKKRCQRVKGKKNITKTRRE